MLRLLSPLRKMLKLALEPLQNLCRYLFYRDEDLKILEHVTCRTTGSPEPRVWTLQPDLFCAVCENDHRTVSVHHEAREFLNTAIPTLHGTYLGALVLSNTTIVNAIVADLLLSRAIPKTEHAQEMHIQEVFRHGRWWAGCGYYVDHLLQQPNDSPAAVSVRRSRWLARVLRDQLLILRQLAFSLRELFRLRKEIGVWELPINGGSESVNAVDVLWIEPATTFVKFFEDFVKVAAQRGDIHSIHIAAPLLKAEEVERLGLVWKPFRMSWQALGRVYVRGVLARIHEVADILSRPMKSEPLRLYRTMRRFWTARIVGNARDTVWESAFAKLISHDRPTLAFVTHMVGTTIPAFCRAVRAMPQVKTVYIQHGVNARVCCRLLYDEYWLLLPEDKSYLESLGVKPSQIRMVNRNKEALLGCLANGSHQCNRSKKAFFLVQHALAGTPLTWEYLLQSLDSVARVVEEQGWQLVVRPHPANRHIPDQERLLGRYPAIRVVNPERPLIQQLQEEKPSVAMTFFSTSVVEAIMGGGLPLMLQAGLESITESTICDYDTYGIVLRDEKQMETQLRSILLDEEYRKEQYLRVWNNLYRVVTEAADIKTAYVDVLNSAFTGRNPIASPAINAVGRAERVGDFHATL